MVFLNFFGRKKGQKWVGANKGDQLILEILTGKTFLLGRVRVCVNACDVPVKN